MYTVSFAIVEYSPILVFQGCAKYVLAAVSMSLSNTVHLLIPGPWEVPNPVYRFD